jgi:hypothetical protein
MMRSENAWLSGFLYFGVAYAYIDVRNVFPGQD